MKLIAISFLLLCLFSTEAEEKTQEKTIANIPSPQGLVVKTGNYLSSIEVRAKNTLPHICETTVQARGEQISIPAMPLKWSNWTKLVEYTNSSNIKISYTPKCDANGVILQARYH